MTTTTPVYPTMTTTFQAKRCPFIHSGPEPIADLSGSGPLRRAPRKTLYRVKYVDITVQLLEPSSNVYGEMRVCGWVSAERLEV